jgi:hypothetical protein
MQCAPGAPGYRDIEIYRTIFLITYLLCLSNIILYAHQCVCVLYVLECVAPERIYIIIIFIGIILKAYTLYHRYRPYIIFRTSFILC